jgi:hypothetical protein
MILLAPESAADERMLEQRSTHVIRVFYVQRSLSYQTAAVRNEQGQIEAVCGALARLKSSDGSCTLLCLSLSRRAVHRAPSFGTYFRVP